MTVLKWAILGALLLFGVVVSYRLGSSMMGADSPLAGAAAVLVFLLVVWVSHASERW